MENRHTTVILRLQTWDTLISNLASRNLMTPQTSTPLVPARTVCTASTSHLKLSSQVLRCTGDLQISCRYRIFPFTNYKGSRHVVDWLCV